VRILIFTYPSCNAHVPYCIVLSPLQLYIIFPHCLINSTTCGRKLLKTYCVFWFSVHLLSETFLILRRTERNMIINYIFLHVKYPLCLSHFNETCIFLTYFRKILKYQISRKSVQWGGGASYSMRMDGRTDVTKLIVAFRNFANTPNKNGFLDWLLNIVLNKYHCCRKIVYRVRY